VIEMLIDIDANEVLTSLWQHGIITLTVIGNDTDITFTSLARTYIDVLLDTADTTQRNIIYRAIKRLADYLAIYQDGWSCVQMLKAALRITLPPTSSLDLAHTFVHTIERTGQWTVWIDYLTMLLNKVEDSDRLWVLTRLGVANRQLGHSEEAAYYLTETLEQAGFHGSFVYQVEALIELSVLFRSRLNYAAAKQLLWQANDLDQRYQESMMQQRIELERFQLQVAEDTADSWATLSIKESTPHLMYLTAQVELLQGNYEEAMIMAQSLHEQVSKDDPKYPRVVALLGRIHFEQKEWDSAVDETSWAMQAMEARNDHLASVHTKINLALMYIQQQRPHTALKYLQSLPMGYW
jgi:tetratricopeptide (TPR) repeat protein